MSKFLSVYLVLGWKKTGIRISSSPTLTTTKLADSQSSTMKFIQCPAETQWRHILKLLCYFSKHQWQKTFRVWWGIIFCSHAAVCITNLRYCARTQKHTRANTAASKTWDAHKQNPLCGWRLWTFLCCLHKLVASFTIQLKTDDLEWFNHSHPHVISRRLEQFSIRIMLIGQFLKTNPWLTCLMAWLTYYWERDLQGQVLRADCSEKLAFIPLLVIYW